jgi:hypothetical protein
VAAEARAQAIRLRLEAEAKPFRRLD